jgi:hypothetical protein
MANDVGIARAGWEQDAIAASSDRVVEGSHLRTWRSRAEPDRRETTRVSPAAPLRRTLSTTRSPAMMR